MDIMPAYHPDEHTVQWTPVHTNSPSMSWWTAPQQAEPVFDDEQAWGGIARAWRAHPFTPEELQELLQDPHVSSAAQTLPDGVELHQIPDPRPAAAAARAVQAAPRAAKPPVMLQELLISTRTLPRDVVEAAHWAGDPLPLDLAIQLDVQWRSALAAWATQSVDREHTAEQLRAAQDA